MVSAIVFLGLPFFLMTSADDIVLGNNTIVLDERGNQAQEHSKVWTRRV
jgi:hypothetical protein